MLLQIVPMIGLMIIHFIYCKFRREHKEIVGHPEIEDQYTKI